MGRRRSGRRRLVNDRNCQFVNGLRPIQTRELTDQRLRGTAEGTWITANAQITPVPGRSNLNSAQRVKKAGNSSKKPFALLADAPPLENRRGDGICTPHTSN